MHRNLGCACRQALASAHIERHAGPPPIVDVELESHISLSSGIQCNVRLVPVSRNFLSEHDPAAILASYYVLRRDGMDSLEQLRLFGAPRVGVEGDRRPPTH